MNIKTQKINDLVFRLTVRNGANDVNVVVLKGKKGTVVIDTAYGNRAEELKKAIEELTPQPVICVINTHHHFDHIGANNLFNCPVIAHENARPRIGGQFYNLAPYLTEGLPDRTLRGEMKLHFEDEILEIRSLPPAHSDGDLIIYLKNDRTLLMGDLLFSGTLPFVDLNSGGDIHGEMAVFRKIPEWYPRCERIIAGHGEDFTMNQFVRYSGIIGSSVDLIETSLEKGMGKEEIAESRDYRELLDKLEDGEKFSQMWIDSIADSVGGTQSIIAPLTEILRDRGIEEAVSFYRENHGSGVWKSTEREINLLAYNLMFRNRNDEALRFFTLYTEMWPESANAWDSLGEYYLNLGDREAGRRYYEKALEMDPERDYIKEILETIGS